MKKINAKHAPKAIGPYSQAIVAGDYLFASGAIGVNPESGNPAEGIKEQTKRAMDNLKMVLFEANIDFSNVVKFTIYLNSMDDFVEMNEVYGKYLSKPFPARATVEVSRLPMDLLIEIDAIAYLK